MTDLELVDEELEAVEDITSEDDNDVSDIAEEGEMDALQVLLGATSAQQVETFRIPKRAGIAADLILQLGSLDDRMFEHLRTQAEKPANREARRRGETSEQDTPLFLRLVVANGVVHPKLDDRAVLNAHGVRTGEKLVRKLMLPGEIVRCAELIMDLSGYSDDAVQRVKN